MFENYLIIVLRNLFRHKVYSLINIAGLAAGMACCLLIGLFVWDELQVDRFHGKSDGIYWLVREMRLENGGVDIGPNTSGAAGPALKQDYPEVEKSVRYLSWGGVWTKYEDRGFELQFCLTDPEFLDVFDFEVIKGNRKTVLADPLSVLVTESTANRVFGDVDPMGKTISVDDRYMGGDYVISGIVKDPPEQSTLQFDIVCATANPRWTRSVFENWAATSTWRPVRNFILLREGADAKALEDKLPAFMERYMGFSFWVFGWAFGNRGGRRYRGRPCGRQPDGRG